MRRHRLPWILLAFPASAPASTVLWTVPGSEVDADCGAAVLIVGDVDGDGHADFAVGEPRFGALPQVPDRGRVRLFSGKTGKVLWTRTGGILERFGSTMAGGGDLTGDGVPDLVVGSPGAVNVDFFQLTYYGAVSLLDGATGATIKTWIGLTEQSAGFSESLAVAPDVEGDGALEVAFGAPRATASGFGGSPLPEAGLAVIVSTGAVPWQEFMRGSGAGHHFGTAVAGFDLGSDGFGDVAVGAPDVSLSVQFPPFTFSNVGRISVFRPDLNPFTSDSALQTVNGGIFEGLRLGAVLSRGGDVDGDGVPDLLAGCPDFGAGQVRIYSGMHLGLLSTWSGAKDGDRFGAAVADAGDVNGDGHADVVVGAPWAGDVSQVLVFNRGAVQVRSGKDGAVMGSAIGSASHAHLGQAVSGGGDVDQDGRPDVLAGAPDEVVSGSATGQARVYDVLDFPASWQLLGSGLAGTQGIPAIGLTAPPETCQPTRLVLGNSAIGPAPTTLFLGLHFNPTPTGWGGTLYPVPFANSLSFTLPPGGIEIPFTVPCAAQLWGTKAYLQQLVADAGAPKGVAFSACLEITHGGF